MKSSKARSDHRSKNQDQRSTPASSAWPRSAETWTTSLVRLWDPRVVIATLSVDRSALDSLVRDSFRILGFRSDDKLAVPPSSIVDALLYTAIRRLELILSVEVRLAGSLQLFGRFRDDREELGGYFKHMLSFIEAMLQAQGPRDEIISLPSVRALRIMIRRHGTKGNRDQLRAIMRPVARDRPGRPRALPREGRDQLIAHLVNDAISHLKPGFEHVRQAHSGRKHSAGDEDLLAELSAKGYAPYEAKLLLRTRQVSAAAHALVARRERIAASSVRVMAARARSGRVR